MNLDPELATVLRSDPFFSQPPTLPEGISLHEFAREQGRIRVHQPFDNYHRNRLPPDSPCTSQERRLLVEDGEIPIRVITPTTSYDHSTSAYPVLVWLHGGGWIVGDLDMDDAHLRTISIDLQLAIVNVGYRLVPEHPFPTPFNDSYAALRWVAEHASEFGIALEKGFLVGGDSAGANIAAAVALQARDDPFFEGRGLTGQYLRELLAVHPLAHPNKFEAELHSFEDNKDAPLVNSEHMLNSFTTYGAPPADLRVSPLLAPSHANLPPAFIQVMEYDPVRDHGLVYEKVLREAGVATKLARNPGTLHGFYYWYPALAASAKIDRDAREGLRWLLTRTSTQT